VARRRGRILALSLIALLFLSLAAQAEPSRVVPAEEILKKIELGQPVEYDGVTIVGDLNISKLELPWVFVERTDEEKEYFSLTENAKLVVSPIEITGCLILGSLDLNGTVLQENLTCENTTFEGSVYLIRTHFQQVANFGYARFNQIANFWGAQFNQTANFPQAQFNQTAYFPQAQFNQTANFQNAQFNQTAFFPNAQFNQTANFQNAQFNQTAYFSNAQFNQTAFFPNAQFNQTAYFLNAQFNQIAYFSNAQFNQYAIFSDAQFNQEAQFMDANFLDLSFDNCLFSKDPFFDNAQINGALSLYRTKYDKLNIRWSSIHDLAYDDTAYYQLIENFKKLGFTDDASECYYSYRCKHREELFRQGKFDSWFFDLLAWATNGYGLRPVRPLGWSVLFIFLGGVFFFVTKSISRSKGPEPSGNRRRAIRGKDSPPRAGEVSFWENLYHIFIGLFIDSPPQVNEVSIWEALLLSATYFTSGASAIISSVPEEFRPLGRSRYVVVILRLLGWVFFVLFLTSLGKIA
jgi:hypothetical protein